jgi:hypothetical protein
MREARESRVKSLQRAFIKRSPPRQTKGLFYHSEKKKEKSFNSE